MDQEEALGGIDQVFSNHRDISAEGKEQDMKDPRLELGRYQLALLQSRLDYLHAQCDFLVRLHQALSEDIATESSPDIIVFRILCNWRLQHEKVFKQKRITEKQLLCHFTTVDELLRDVDRCKDALPKPLDDETLRSFYLAEVQQRYCKATSYVSSLMGRVNVMKASMDTLAASEASSTDGNAAQLEWPADHFYVFEFAAIPFDRPVDMKAFILEHPIVMHKSEILKLRNAACRAILERGDKEQARDYGRHALALCYASFTETSDGLYRILKAISADGSQSRLTFEKDVDWLIHSTDWAVLKAMEEVAAEEMQRTRSEHPHAQGRTEEEMQWTRNEHPHAQGHTEESDEGQQDVFDGSSQTMEAESSE